MSDVPQEPVWLSITQVKMLHAETLRLFGGSPGLRDEGLLESALGRPKHLHAYGEAPSLSDLAAAYGYGLAKNHAFVDGNKRVALLAIRAFLFRNGYASRPDQVETVTTMEGVAAGAVDQEALAAWVRDSASQRDV